MSFIFYAILLLTPYADSFMKSQAFAQETKCDYEKNKVIFSKETNGYSAIWSLKESAGLFASFSGSDSAYVNYAHWVRANTAWSALDILRNHIEVGKKIISGMNPDDPFPKEVLRGNRNITRIINGEIGLIRPIRCLESIPFREMLKVVDLREHSVELNATVLRKHGAAKIVGDFYFNPATIDNGATGTAESNAARNLREQLMRDGWIIAAHFHNHPFSFHNPYGDYGGTLGPSDPDIQMYRSLKPELAIISNGIDSVLMNQTDLAKFEL